jgi:hypothetical protein
LPNNIKIAGNVKNQVDISRTPIPAPNPILRGDTTERAGSRKLKSLISEPLADPEKNSKSHTIFNAVAMQAMFKPIELSFFTVLSSK